MENREIRIKFECQKMIIKIKQFERKGKKIYTFFKINNKKIKEIAKKKKKKKKVVINNQVQIINKQSNEKNKQKKTLEKYIAEKKTKNNKLIFKLNFAKLCLIILYFNIKHRK